MMACLVVIGNTKQQSRMIFGRNWKLRNNSELVYERLSHAVMSSMAVTSVS